MSIWAHHVPLGARETCRRCGRTVWLRGTGTMGSSGTWPHGTHIYEWCSRKGSKPRPVQCPKVGDWPFMHHEVEGKPTAYFVLPNGDVRTR